MKQDNGNHGTAHPIGSRSVPYSTAAVEIGHLRAINAEMAEALEVAASALRGVVMSYRDAPQQFTEPLRQVRAALDKSRT